jgi:uncharacterized membrane protein YgdD (TMEM256/DUF423 family)
MPIADGRHHYFHLLKVHINTLRSGSIFCFIAVAGGAFGAHALKKVLTVEQLSSWDTAIRFLMFHGLALLVFHFLRKENLLLYKWPAVFVFWGTILFSGSIMLLVTVPVAGFNISFLGPVTPIGGILLLTGWAILIFQIKTI